MTDHNLRKAFDQYAPNRKRCGIMEENPVTLPACHGPHQYLPRPNTRLWLVAYLPYLSPRPHDRHAVAPHPDAPILFRKKTSRGIGIGIACCIFPPSRLASCPRGQPSRPLPPTGWPCSPGVVCCYRPMTGSSAASTLSRHTWHQKV
jgi:hypothetical protein